MKIAYLGLGTMGSAMAGRLLKANYELSVWNRTPARARGVAEQGARQASTPAEAVAEADMIIYSLSNDMAVQSLLQDQNGILQAVHPGQIAIDMSTVHPETSRCEAAMYRQHQVRFLDAPVFGSRSEALRGALWIGVGGNEETFEAAKPVLESMAQTVHYMGTVGKGSAMKLVGSLIEAVELEAIGEALVLATKAGLDATQVLDVLRDTDFSSRILEKAATSLIRRDFSTHFALKHMLKDANLISRLADDLNSPVPASEVVKETIKTAMNQGWGEQNSYALIKGLELEAGVVVQ